MIVRKPFAVGCFVSAGLTMLAMTGCGQASQSTGEPAATSLDPLLLPSGDAGFPDSGVFACPACIQSSGGAPLTALGPELKPLRTEARPALPVRGARAPTSPPGARPPPGGAGGARRAGQQPVRVGSSMAIWRHATRREPFSPPGELVLRSGHPLADHRE